eukprot:CAMPEP_0170510990 /NCGR_PEP_ID=MMETSP0208-20121228/66062_1 /TAXON_ID=197538 /ORGANISM="Strombidium inclinatum, Strain S3" /LENGTH=163 /DNA_ID=CAMNT_0010794491 /DNA_START=300 /DNA_END=791 /DNA_ORIENTATION=+
MTTSLLWRARRVLRRKFTILSHFWNDLAAGEARLGSVGCHQGGDRFVAGFAHQSLACDSLAGRHPVDNLGLFEGHVEGLGHTLDPAQGLNLLVCHTVDGELFVSLFGSFAHKGFFFDASNVGLGLLRLAVSHHLIDLHSLIEVQLLRLLPSLALPLLVHGLDK